MADNLTIVEGTFVTGKFGQGLQLSGNSNGSGTPGSAAVSSGRIPQTGAFSVGLFFKRNGNPSHLEILVSQASFFRMAIQTNGQMDATFGGANGILLVTTSPVVTDNAWHYAEFVFTGATNGTSVSAKVYLDGTLLNSTTLTESASSADRAAAGEYLAFGRFSNSANFYNFAGVVDEAAVWTGDHGGVAPTAAISNTATGLVNLYHFDGDGNDSKATSSSGLTIARDNSAIYYAPNAWDDRGSERVANSNGAYLKFDFTGTSLSLNLTALAAGLTPPVAGGAAYPAIGWFIDDLPEAYASLAAGQTTLAIASGLAAGTHHAYVFLRNMPGNDRWSCASAFRLVSFGIDTGATVSAPSGPLAIQSKIAMFWGDSTWEGERSRDNSGPPAGGNPMDTVVPLLAKALGAEYGHLAYGGTGYDLDGPVQSGSVPRNNQAYAYYSSGRPRLVSGLFPTQPDYVFNGHGINGAAALTQAIIATSISQMRAAAPNAWLIYIVPLGGWGRTVITAAVNAARSAGDPKVALIDLGAGVYDQGVLGSPAGTVGTTTTGNGRSSDNLHYLARTNAEAAVAQMKQLQHILEPRRFTVVAT